MDKYKLLEIVKLSSNGNESQSIVSFEDETAAIGEVEFKSGQAAKSAAYIAYCYILIDITTARIVKQLFGSTSPEITINPRLYSNLTPSGEGTETLSKYYTMTDATANYHSKLGSTMKDDTKDSIVLCLIDEKGNLKEKTKWERPVDITND